MIILKIDINRALIAVSKTEENFTSTPSFHGINVGFMCYRLALTMGKPEPLCQKALICGLLHDCGVSSQDEIRRLLNDEVDVGVDSQHSIRGYRMLQECAPLRQFARPVQYHHGDWRRARDGGLTEEECFLSSIVNLCDRLDVACRKTRIFDLLQHGQESEIVIEPVYDYLIANSDCAAFYPGILAALHEMIEVDDFWFYFRAHYIETLILKQDLNALFPAQTRQYFIDIAQFFSRIVDNKSTYTYQHSRKVAELAFFIASKMGVDEAGRYQIFVAGLLHDVGKLFTDEEVLNKKGRLDNAEYKTIRRHVTDTRAILRYILDSEKVVTWAADHHERLDGSGYPLRKRAGQLALESRIMAVADVFQALCQHRPYRSSLTLEQAIAIVNDEASGGKLCPEVVAVFNQHARECYRIAT